MALNKIIHREILIGLILIFLVGGFVGGVAALEGSDKDVTKWGSDPDDTIKGIKKLKEAGVADKAEFNANWKSAIKDILRMKIVQIEDKDVDGEARGILWDVLDGENKNSLIQSFKSDIEMSSFITAVTKNKAKEQGVEIPKDFEIKLKKEGLEYNKEKEWFEYKLKDGRSRVLKIDDLPLDTSKTKLPGLKSIKYNDKNGFYYDFGSGDEKKRREIVCEQGRINSNGEIVDYDRLNKYQESIKVSGFDDKYEGSQIVQIGNAGEADDTSKWSNGIHMWGMGGLKASIGDFDFRVHDDDPSSGIGYGFVNPVEGYVYHMRGMFHDNVLGIDGEIPATNNGLLVLDSKFTPTKDNMKVVQGLNTDKMQFLKIVDNKKNNRLEISGNIKYAAVYVEDANRVLDVQGISEEGFVIKDSEKPYIHFEGGVLGDKSADGSGEVWAGRRENVNSYKPGERAIRVPDDEGINLPLLDSDDSVERLEGSKGVGGESETKGADEKASDAEKAGDSIEQFKEGIARDTGTREVSEGNVIKKDSANLQSIADSKEPINYRSLTKAIQSDSASIPKGQTGQVTVHGNTNDLTTGRVAIIVSARNCGACPERISKLYGELSAKQINSFAIIKLNNMYSYWDGQDNSVYSKIAKKLGVSGFPNVRYLNNGRLEK